MLQFIRALNLLYVFARRYKLHVFCTLMADSLRKLRTAVREWECCIYINFHEHILNSFQLIQRKQKYYCQTSKGNNSKKYIDKSYTSCGLHI